MNTLGPSVDGSRDGGTNDLISHLGYPASNLTRFASVPGYDRL